MRATLFFVIVLNLSCSLKYKTSYLPIYPRSDLPIVDVIIGGRSVRGLIDTGASVVVVSPELGFGRKGEYVILPELCLATDCTENLVVWSQESDFWQESQIEVIVGMSILKHRVVIQDHLKSIELNPKESACLAFKEVVPLSFDASGRPLLTAQIGSKNFKDVLLDTGAVYVLLNQESIDKLTPNSVFDITPSEGCSFTNCNEQVQQGILSELCIEGHCEQQIEAKFPVFNAIGNAFLKRVKIKMDFPKSQLVFCQD